MTNPQQPELGRSGRGATSEGSAKAKASSGPPPTTGAMGPIPEDNLPGHHPEHEQDKPTGPPPIPPLVDEGSADRDGARANGAGRNGRGPDGGGGREQAAETTVEAPARPSGDAVRVRFPFAFEWTVAPVAALFGATPFSAWVDVDGDSVTIRYGLWSLRTSLDNVDAAERTGPYAWWKIAGPPHLSVADRGVTFATSTKGGVCIRFRRPVRGALPFGLLRHPAATVTVDDPDALIEALTDGG
ncbi:MAG TPA: hypothetical protein VGB14_18640 [Acidimicrobiales bacterium]|jgi:hypothetical protein